MNARKGATYVPPDHDVFNSFYRFKFPNSPPNNAVAGKDWVADPKSFNGEAPRTLEQCRHVDGMTLINSSIKPDGVDVSWLVWEIPAEAISYGRALICYTRGFKESQKESLDKGDIRFHYAVPQEKGKWKVYEDVHKKLDSTIVKQLCMPVVTEMDEADLKAAREGGMWVAVEWKAEAIFEFDHLVST